MSATIPAAVWLRVSTTEQTSDNQVPDIEAYCAHHGYAVVRTWAVADSAWRDGTGGPEYRKALTEVLAAAYAGRFRALVAWSLDRIVRTGPEDALRLIRELRERHCTLVSVTETWLSGAPEVQALLVSFAGWMAERESARRSERIRAGIARRKAEGKPVGGRKAGTRDKRKRSNAGYLAAWDRRRAQAAPGEVAS